jgi:hypothetical protein
MDFLGFSWAFLDDHVVDAPDREKSHNLVGRVTFNPI